MNKLLQVSVEVDGSGKVTKYIFFRVKNEKVTIRLYLPKHITDSSENRITEALNKKLSVYRVATHFYYK